VIGTSKFLSLYVISVPSRAIFFTVDITLLSFSGSTTSTESMLTVVAEPVTFANFISYARCTRPSEPVTGYTGVATTDHSIAVRVPGLSTLVTGLSGAASPDPLSHPPDTNSANTANNNIERTLFISTSPGFIDSIIVHFGVQE